MTMQEIADIVMFALLITTFASLALMAFVIGNETWNDTRRPKIYQSLLSGQSFEEKVRGFRREQKLYDEISDLKKTISDYALKFEYASALLRDAQNNHKMSKKLRSEIDAIIREIDEFATNAKKHTGDTK